MKFGWVPAILIKIISLTAGCQLSEFQCNNNRCILTTQFCDGINDCGDSSDEPRFCTPCNRTYYGNVGKTYELEIHRPKEDKMPFICHLMFSAGNEEFGDIVQIMRLNIIENIQEKFSKLKIKILDRPPVLRTLESPIENYCKYLSNVVFEKEAQKLWKKIQTGAKLMHKQKPVSFKNLSNY